MRFLVDNSLSPVVSKGLRSLGHDSVHLRDRHLHGEEDDFILDLAGREGRIILTADSDFGTLLALGGHALPSVILLREGLPHDPLRQVEILADQLEALETMLIQGCIVVFREGRIRVRGLPISDE